MSAPAIRPAVPVPALAAYAVPPGGHATRPPEERGLCRDGVRLLVAGPGRVRHARFDDLPGLLAPGDVLVVNTSATLPAAVPAAVLGPGGFSTTVHVGDGLDDGTWVVEVRRPDNSGPELSLAPGRVVALDGGVRLTLLDSYPDRGRRGARLWRAGPDDAVSPDRVAYLRAHGRPVSYGDLASRPPLSAYQTVYARTPGSAELVSAGRPFSERLLTRLVASGVTIAPLVLHTGLSSPEVHEPPAPERFEVPPDTARLVRSARAAGRRVVAVGTTVVRALESAVDDGGRVRGASGWTGLVLDRNRPARVVDGLVTGLHEPQASHLSLLESVVGPDLVAAAYAAAVGPAPRDDRPGDDVGYLWHEFGDSMLLLPERPGRATASGTASRSGSATRAVASGRPRGAAARPHTR